MKENTQLLFCIMKHTISQRKKISNTALNGEIKREWSWGKIKKWKHVVKTMDRLHGRLITEFILPELLRF